MSLDKLLKLEKNFEETDEEFIKCRDKVIKIDQYKFSISERINEAKKLLDKCWEKKNLDRQIILNSDIEINKYKKVDNDNIYLNSDLMKKDTLKELSEKYSNKMIEEKELDEISKKFNLNALEEKFKYEYIKKMIENEMNSYPSISCLDEKIVKKYKKISEDLRGKDLIPHHYVERKIVIDKTIEYYPDLKYYPTHQEYEQCVYDRKNSNFKLY